MELGMISDTHDNVDAVKKAAGVFESRGIETVVHCGDFISPPVISFFEGFELHGVLGNNDGEKEGLKTMFESLGNDSELHGRFGEVKFGGTEIAFLHGEDKQQVYETAESGDYDYVLYGHYHVKEVEDFGSCTVINPGGHFPTVPHEHRTVVILDTQTNEIEFVNLTK